MARCAVSKVLVVLCVLGAAAPADARSEEDFRYAFERVWPTAIRLLRIDLQCPIEEQDRDNGYFLFEYQDGKRAYPGSVELIRTRSGGAEVVRVVVQIPAMPRYVERHILTRLQRKLGDDFGPPREPPDRGEGDGERDPPDEDEDEDEGNDEDEAKDEATPGDDGR